MVTVKDDGQGNLTATKSATKTNSDGTTVTKDVPVFNNTYTAKPVILTGDTALTVTKRVTGFNSSEAYSFNLALATPLASATRTARPRLRRLLLSRTVPPRPSPLVT